MGRISDTFQSKPRWRYFRRCALRGPIADLERAYYDRAEA
jgi:hypothetical protein